MSAPVCVCDGRYEGCEHGRRCGDPVLDDWRGPWCAPCNQRRFVHIDAAFEQIAEGFK